MKTTVIALANQRGDEGKTTTAVNLGIGLARQGKKVLLVDADSQGNLTDSLGWKNPDALEQALPTVLRKIINDEPPEPQDAILHHEEDIDLMPSNIELSALEMTLFQTMRREYVHADWLKTVWRFPLPSARRKHRRRAKACLPTIPEARLLWPMKHLQKRWKPMVGRER